MMEDEQDDVAQRRGIDGEQEQRREEHQNEEGDEEERQGQIHGERVRCGDEGRKESQ